MSGAGVKDLVGKFQGEYGEATAGIGMRLPNVKRLPTGILAFDIASGGGIPMNRMTMVYGKESSGKTNLALCAVREHQRRYPKRSCVFIDVEGTFDTDWASKLGVDVESLVLLRPDYAEQVVQMSRELLFAPDCGLIVTDSIAAMATMQEMDAEADAERPGTQARAIAKLVRQTGAVLKKAEKEGYCPTLIWVNQTRYKIGVMFGSPETMPGGEAPRFMTSMRVRLYGKNIVDEAVSKAMPVRKLTTGTIEKWKVPIIATGFKYEMAMVPHKGIERGRCGDWKAAHQYLAELGDWEDRGAKAKGPRYRLMGQDFDTQVAAWEWLQQEDRIDTFREKVVAQAMEKLERGQARKAKKKAARKKARRKAVGAARADA